MLGGTSDDARLNLMAWSCINSCIYLLPAIPRVYLAESNFRFRCYRTPIFSALPVGIGKEMRDAERNAVLQRNERHLAVVVDLCQPRRERVCEAADRREKSQAQIL